MVDPRKTPKEQLEEQRKKRKTERGKRKEEKDQFAKEQIKAEEEKKQKSKQQQADFKKRQKQEREEYEEFRKKKDAEEAKIAARNTEREKKRTEQLEYLKTLSERNRKHMQEEQIERDAQELKEKTKKEAEHEAMQTKRQADSKEKQEARALKQHTQKERGKADIYEREHIDMAREEARKKQVKLKAKQQVETDQLDAQIARMPQGQKQAQLERTERKKIQDKYLKKERDIEVDANKEIAQIKKQAKAMRDSATNYEKEKLFELQSTTKQSYRYADKEAARKKNDAQRKERQTLEAKNMLEDDED